MPCHEYCGSGHQAMWARVRVIDRNQFMKLAKEHRRVSCVAE
jgi:cytochrome c oxidase subunit 2